MVLGGKSYSEIEVGLFLYLPTWSWMFHLAPLITRERGLYTEL